ncbi:glycoside hydrolase family 172 protein [Gemmatimonadota bacterium]
MNTKHCLYRKFLIVVPLLASACGVSDRVTTGTLYEEMVDMVGLAEFPEPAYETVQFSSYDRRSNLPGGAEWFANSDGFGGEPIPGFEAVLQEPGEDSVGVYLIADVAGPGALVRLWTASIDGTVQLWLDGSGEPLFSGSANDFFRRPLDSFPQSQALNRANLERTLYQRDAVYAPIPFAQRLRLEWTGNIAHIHFYQMEVRKYATGTRVKTFKPEDLEQFRETIDNVTAVLADPDLGIALNSAGEASDISVTLAPGASEDALILEGSAAINRLELKLEAQDLDRALRQTVLHIHFDESPWGQVQAPLGDFFGAAPGVNPYQSLPFTVLPDGTMISRFVMPFRMSARIHLENFGDQRVTVSGSVRSTDYEWDEHRSMHFRARWRVDHDLIADPDAVQDLPFIVARGKGVYVGTTSILLNPNPIPTPWGNWWGEGDEKVFVDDDSLPSLFGTGSEDYYNYSWSSPDIFLFPYCGQPRNDGPGNRGFVTNYRWHILDPLPFEQGIGFYMELFSHERTPGLSYARIGYHYARPGVTDDHMAIRQGDLRELRLPGGWMPEGRFGSRNSNFYQTEDLSPNRGLQFQSGRLYAGARLPVWRPASSGQTLRLSVPIRTAGEYRIHFVTRLDRNGGRATMQFDGESAELTTETTTIDFYRPHRTLLRNFTLKPRDLTAGTHVLEFIYDGADEGVDRPELGIDFVWVQEVR